jgi:hypothetical protein
MKTVIKGYKYRIYPTDEKSLSYSKCSEFLTELKKEKPIYQNQYMMYLEQN